MASFVYNALQVNFESMLKMDDEGMCAVIVSTVAKRKLVVTKEVSPRRFIFRHISRIFRQRYAVQLSILLEKLVKADLGESVALHPLRALNTKSVLTYLKKNQASVPTATDGSKSSGDKEVSAEQKKNKGSGQSKQQTALLLQLNRVLRPALTQTSVPWRS
ncbi:hypothetical protein F511_24683 [Dorcoceras hygrometricum]|uniref:Uncharacterized protein n=1 Tax=Dorcoceras hygrometricum TaxID=472368 RepID=A0A2Z7B1J8_9LAMI|nr:hypothetical protein F511_24683 [Dorcoceras hygrometricum]